MTARPDGSAGTQRAVSGLSSGPARSAVSARERAALLSFSTRIAPDDAGAHNNLGVLYFRKGMAVEAVDAFTRALDLDPRMSVAQRNLEIAYFNGGVYDERVAEWGARLAANPQDHDARWGLGRAALLLGQLQTAMEQFEALHAAAPRDVEVLRALARAEHKSGNLEAAARWNATALAVRPEDARLQYEAGEIAYHRGLNDDALGALRRAIALDPDFADAHYLMGFVLGDMGRHDEAGACSRRALRLNPSLGKPHPNLSLERFDATSYETMRAVRADRGALIEVRVDSAGAALHFNLGLAFRQKGYLREALREYRLALDRGEDSALVRRAMAEVHLLQREYAAAVQIYDRLLADSPDDAKLWNERGVALHQHGRHEEAALSYERAVRAEAGYAPALNNLGVAYWHAGDIERAVGAFRRALEQAPSFVRARLNLALLLYRRGEYPLCLDVYRQVLRLAPEHPVAWNGIGLVLAALRRFADARNAFARAIDARPNYAEARYNLSFTLSNLGDYAGALRETKAALELDPYYVAQKFELALDLQHEDPAVGVNPELGAERRSETVDTFAFDAAALRALFAELDVAPDGAGGATAGSYARASALAAAGDVERAIAEVQRALGSGAPAADGLILLGELFARQGALGEALERFRQAREIAPDSIVARAGEVRMLTQLGRGSDAGALADALIAEHPEDVDLLLLVARVRVDCGRIAQAVEALDAARRLAPMRGDVLKQAGDVAVVAGDPERAMAAYRDAITLDRGFASARLDLAALLSSTGRDSEAEAELMAALDVLPTYGEAALALAALRRRMHRAEETIDLLAGVLRRDPYHLEALQSLGESLLQCGRRADAAIAFARILRFDAEHVGALYCEGVLLAEARDYESALGRWQRVVDLEPASETARRARRDMRTAQDLMRIFAVRGRPDQRGAA